MLRVQLPHNDYKRHTKIFPLMESPSFPESVAPYPDAGQAYLIAEGQILISGNAEELVNDQKAREIYLGEKFRM